MQGELFGLPDIGERTAMSLDGDAKQRARNKREFRQSTTEENAAREALAIARGTHTPFAEWRTICSVCRQWVNSIVYVSPQDRLKRFCIDCCPADVREEILAGRAGREDNAAAMEEFFGGGAVEPVEIALPDGVSRVEDIGLPDP